MPYLVNQSPPNCQSQRNLGIGDEADLSQDLDRMTRNIYITIGLFLAGSIALSAWLFWPRQETLGERLYRSL